MMKTAQAEEGAFTMTWKAMAAGTIRLAVLLAFVSAGAEAAIADMSSGRLSGRLLITGSSTMDPLMKAIGQRFQALHPEVRIEVQAGGSGRGVADVRQGKVDIGMASRVLTDKESDLYGFPIARDGVCVIIHRDNPVKGLTERQVADIFTGRIVNWKKAGGRDEPITVVNPSTSYGYSSVELFTHYFGLKYSDIRAQISAGDNQSRIREVAGRPNAIAYASIGDAERKARTGIPIKLVRLGGVEASSKNIRTGNYPIFRPLTLVTRSLPTGLVKTFIEFSLSSQVTDLIIAYDFVPYMD